MFKLEKSEKLFLKCFLATEYPKDTHLLRLEGCFKIYYELAKELLLGIKLPPVADYSLIGVCQDKMLDYVDANSRNSAGLEMEIFYYKIQILIKMLNKYSKLKQD